MMAPSAGFWTIKLPEAEQLELTSKLDRRRERKRTWRDLRDFVLDASPYSRLVAPLRAVTANTPADIAAEKVAKIKRKLNISNKDLRPATAADITAGTSVADGAASIAEWKSETAQMMSLLGPDSEHAHPYPLLQLNQTLQNAGSSIVSSSSTANLHASQLSASGYLEDYQLPHYIHPEPGTDSAAVKRRRTVIGTMLSPAAAREVKLEATLDDYMTASLPLEPAVLSSSSSRLQQSVKAAYSTTAAAASKQSKPLTAAAAVVAEVDVFERQRRRLAAFLTAANPEALQQSAAVPAPAVPDTSKSLYSCNSSSNNPERRVTGTATATGKQFSTASTAATAAMTAASNSGVYSPTRSAARSRHASPDRSSTAAAAAAVSPQRSSRHPLQHNSTLNSNTNSNNNNKSNSSASFGLGSDAPVTPLQPSAEMRSSLVQLFESSLGTGHWSDAVASQLARPLTAAAAYIPVEATAADVAVAGSTGAGVSLAASQTLRCEQQQFSNSSSCCSPSGSAVEAFALGCSVVSNGSSSKSCCFDGSLRQLSPTSAFSDSFKRNACGLTGTAASATGAGAAGGARSVSSSAGTAASTLLLTATLSAAANEEPGAVWLQRLAAVSEQKGDTADAVQLYSEAAHILTTGTLVFCSFHRFTCCHTAGYQY
jgi:hypothetical protein